MLLNRIAGKNYFVALIILLALTTILVVAAFLVSALIPGAQGRSPDHYEIYSIYEFEPWSFTIEELSVDFSRGGTIVLLNEYSAKQSMLFLGEGRYTKQGEEVDPAQTSGVLIVMEYGLFEPIRGDTLFIPVEDERVYRHAEEILSRQTGTPVIWSDFIPLTFHKQEGLIHYNFIDPDGNPVITPPVLYSPGDLAGTFALYILFILIMLLAFTIFSPDYHHSRYWEQLKASPPGGFNLLLVLVSVLVSLGMKIMPLYFAPPPYFETAGYVLVILILVLFYRYRKIDYLDFGLRRERIRYGYLKAIIAAVLIVGAVTGLPESLDLGGHQTLLVLPITFLFVALPHEMIWRGYIQTTLMRLLGTTGGLLVVMLLVGVVHFIYLYLSAPWLTSNPYTYLEVAVLVPGTACILGYLYLRTENILSCALLHSLLIFLPGIILH